MIRILHAADFHLDSPITGRKPDQEAALKKALLAVPGKIAQIRRREQCDLVLLSGDLFDGPCSPASLQTLRSALEEMAVPVFISPGNHDFCAPDSPWLTAHWPSNVHIFTRPALESVALPQLDCRIYGAGFQRMDCPSLLAGFRPEGKEQYHIGILHGDPTQANSPYNPITASQVRSSGLHYLALGHIHKGGSFRAGSTLCAWPGCPMGRGFDECGDKGVIIAEIGETVQAQFLPLDTPRFYDLGIPAGDDPAEALAATLPAMGSGDHYRVTFIGPSAGIDTTALQAKFTEFPNLELRDRTVPLRDPWDTADNDSLEGVFFRNLKNAMEGQDAQTQRRIQLAAKIARQILDGQEVPLP